MKILVVSQIYWPEPFPTTDICEGLAQLGHEVHVITDVPNYPMGYIYPGYKGGKRRREERNGVKISRTFTIGRRNNTLFRILNYYSFAISSTVYSWFLKKDYDAVFAIQASPIMMVNAALSYARRTQKKCLFYTMDLWPASLSAGGISESSPIYKLFGWISRRLYRRADRILITSTMFREYLQDNFQIADAVIRYLPQYAAAQFDHLPPAFQKDTVDLMFAGNVGAAQSLVTVLEAAEYLKDIPFLRWHIVGDGSELKNLQALAQKKGLSSVIFHGRKPPEQMPQFYAMADAMLVTLTADPFVGLTLPNKVQSYMAAEKPILAAANGEIPKVLAEAGCGFCAEAENSKALADAVRQFLNTPDKARLGQNARVYYERHFTRQQFMKTLEQELQTLR